MIVMAIALTLLFVVLYLGIVTLILAAIAVFFPTHFIEVLLNNDQELGFKRTLKLFLFLPYYIVTNTGV